MSSEVPRQVVQFAFVTALITSVTYLLKVVSLLYETIKFL